MPAVIKTKGEVGRGTKIGSAGGLSARASLQWMFGQEQVWDVTEVESGGYEIRCGSENSPVAAWAKTTTDEGETVYSWRS
jgi:hypothetical protein